MPSLHSPSPLDPPLRILVVEDDEDAQEVVQSLLEFHHIEVDMTATAEDALAKVQDGNAYDGALIDLSLPDADGFTLLNTLKAKEETAELPCIAMTAFHSAEVAVKAIDAGFTGFFAKPLDVITFAQTVDDMLR